MDELNQKLIENINLSGKLFLSHTNLNGKYILRISISSLRTQEEHVKEALELVKSFVKY